MTSPDRILLALALASASTCCPKTSAQSGTIPNRGYAAQELYRQIGPDLSLGVHHNQSCVVDGYLFISGNGHQEIWDISDPYAPAQVAAMDSPHNAGEAEGHQVSFARYPDGRGGHRLHAVTISGRGIDFWDITDARAPQLRNALQLPGINYGDNTEAVWGLSWQGRYVWVGGTNTGIHVVDAADPANPRVVRRITTAALGGISAGPLWALGNLLVVTTPKESAGVVTLDIGDPDDPVVLDSHRPTTGTSSYMGGFFGGAAYLQSPLRTFDVTSDPRSITLLGSFATPRSEYLAFGNGHLYLGSLRRSAGGIGGVLEYEIDDPNALQQIGHVAARPNPDTDDQFPMPIGNLLVLGDDQAAGEQGSFLAPVAIAPDTAAPTVVYANPANGAVGQPPTSRIALSFDDQIELATVDAQSLMVRPLGGAALPGRYGVSQTVVSFWPDATLRPHTTYEVIAPAGGIADLVGNTLTATWHATFRTGSDLGDPDCRIDPLTPSPVGSQAAFRITFPDTERFDYSWDFGDGSPRARGPFASHGYANPGRFPVEVTVTDRIVATHQAEHAALAGGCVTAINNAGYRGASFVDYPGDQGSSVRTTFAVESAGGATELTIRFANGGATPRSLGLWVNGSRIQTLEFAASGSWTRWDSLAVPGVVLDGGRNEIALVADAGTVGPNVDDLTVADSAAILFEAEHGAHSGGVAISTTNPGYHGAGHAAFPGSTTGRNVSLGFSLHVPNPGDHALAIRYGSRTGASCTLALYVNGARTGTITLPAPASAGLWRTVHVTNVTLLAGTNALELVADAGTPGPDIDELGLTAPAPGNRSCAVTQIVHRATTPDRPTSSSGLHVDDTTQRAWAVQADGHTVTVIDLPTRSPLQVIEVGKHPVALAPAPRRGEVWVANRDSHDLSVVRTFDHVVVATIRLPYASQPAGLAFAPDGSACFVALEALGRIVKLDPSTRQIVASLDVGGTPRGIAVSADSRQVLVTRLLSTATEGQVLDLDAASLTLNGIFGLADDPGPDTPDSGRGIPNLLRAVAISPDGSEARVPAKKDNTDRGILRDGQPLTHDNTVRPIVCRLDLATGREDKPGRIDLNDADSPSAVAYSPLGDLVFVTLQGIHRVDVRDTASGETLASLATGLAPQALQVDGHGRLVVLNFLGRGVSIYDVAALLDATDTSANLLGTVAWPVAEPLSPQVLLGKRVFYDAADPRMAFEGYQTCATCHLDGGQDARVWDFTQRGEGFRNTTSLRGGRTAGGGPVHWTGNFDEIQDFENDIRSGFAGLGFLSSTQWRTGTRMDPLGDPKAGLSPELDALAAYVASLEHAPPSPFRRTDGTMTAQAKAGGAVFDRLGCAQCHTGPGRTDSRLDLRHDVGTIQRHSGTRRFQALDGFDTPTLRGVWATAPYFHDGSAANLHGVLTRPGHGNTSGLGNADRNALVAWLRQQDATVDLLRGEEFRTTGDSASFRGSALAIDHPSGRRAVFVPQGTSGSIRWEIPIENAATADLEILYSNSGPKDLVTASVGSFLHEAELIRTGAGKKIDQLMLRNVPLRAGRNTLTLTIPGARGDLQVLELRVRCAGK